MTEIIWAREAGDDAVAQRLASVIAGPGRTSIAVPGGNTPRPIFQALKRNALPWETLTLRLTDDRVVPQDHPASNYGLLRTALGGTAATIHPMTEGEAPGRFDLVWLGMGTDGHVASIFPNIDLPDDLPPATIRTIPDPLPPEAPFPRLTLNMAALTDTDDLILVVRGEDKKRVLDSAIAEGGDLPVARLLRAARCPVTIFWSAS